MTYPGSCRSPAPAWTRSAPRAGPREDVGFRRTVLARSPTRHARHRPALRPARGGRRGGGRAAARARRGGALGDGRAAGPEAAHAGVRSPLRGPARARAKRPQRGDAASRGALDGPQPGRRRRLDLLRRPRRGWASQQTGFDAGPGQAGLDFGCSSGRVVRVLAGALPEVDWHGCDPIPDAIEWAREHLPGSASSGAPSIHRFPTGTTRSTSLSPSQSGATFRSRLRSTGSARWRGLSSPGAGCVLTAHGYQTISHTSRHGVRSAEQLAEVNGALYERGFWYCARVRRARRPRSGEPGLGHCVPIPGVASCPRYPGVARRALRPRSGGGQPRPLRARAELA